MIWGARLTSSSDGFYGTSYKEQGSRNKKENPAKKKLLPIWEATLSRKKKKADYFLGITTASNTCTTPLPAVRSAAVMFAPSIITLPSLMDTVNSAPFTVFNF